MPGKPDWEGAAVKLYQISTQSTSKNRTAGTQAEKIFSFPLANGGPLWYNPHCKKLITAKASTKANSQRLASLGVHFVLTDPCDAGQATCSHNFQLCSLRPTQRNCIVCPRHPPPFRCLETGLGRAAVKLYQISTQSTSKNRTAGTQAEKIFSFPLANGGPLWYNPHCKKLITAKASTKANSQRLASLGVHFVLTDPCDAGQATCLHNLPLCSLRPTR